MKINEDNLCVLKLNTNNNQIYVAYEPIEIQLKEDLKILYNLIEDKNITGKEIFDFIKNHPTLNVLFRTYNFCVYISGTYEGLYDGLDRIKKNFEDPYYRNSLLILCKERALAYSLEKAYGDCTNNVNILGFSHRRVGWSYRPYQLNENFSIHFSTNFGYGGSSYFYTKLKYKDIDIVPISEWVYYRYAQLSEIISASAVHSVNNDSWKLAMEYGQNACNLFNRNEAEFVNQYLKQECDKLLSGLTNIKINTKFKLRKNLDRFDPTFEEMEFTGSELIAFRGEKISGALYFIESIKSLESVISISSYINSLEILNKDIQPVLEKEFNIILNLHPLLNNQLLELKDTYEKLQEKVGEYDKYKFALEEEFEKIEEYKTKNYNEKRDCLESKHLEKYPEYNSCKKALNDAKEKYYALDSNICSLKNNQNSIEKSIAKIGKYFDGIG